MARTTPLLPLTSYLTLPPLLPLSSHSFELLNKIGEGTYGVVYLARDINFPPPSPNAPTTTGPGASLPPIDEGVVALKRMRLDAHDEGVPVTTLREVALLKDLKHENIVCLREVTIAALTPRLFHRIICNHARPAPLSP